MTGASGVALMVKGLEVQTLMLVEPLEIHCSTVADISRSTGLRPKVVST